MEAKQRQVNGKGDRQRPGDQEQYRNNYEKIFMPYKKKMHRVTVPGKLDANKTQIARQVRAKNRWARKSRTHRKSNPLCCDPFGHHKEEKRVVVVKDVHHVVPVAKDPSLAFVSSNLRSLCRKCHNEITAMEKAGKPTEHLFRPDGEGVSNL